MTKLGSMMTRFAGTNFLQMPKWKNDKLLPPITKHPGGVKSITGERYD